ncbi:MAG: thiamine pyrophosphate-dependent enzyme [Thermoplasmatota archaeon]
MSFKYVIGKGPDRGYMLANEAIARAALESDVKVYATYPGSPTVEILTAFDKASRILDDLRCEISVNEKVALEVGAGAAMVGHRSFVSMKSVGTNVASDALYVMAYTGVKGGMVMLLADDPHAHSSQSEQDGRWFGYTAYMPMLDPSGPQEAYDMVKWAYGFSEKHGTIVLLRTTTRVNHQSGIVNTQELIRAPFKKMKFDEDRRNYSAVGITARKGKLRMLERMESMRVDSDSNPFNREMYFDGIEVYSGVPEDEGYELGLLVSGVTYNYALEALKELGIKARIFKPGLINPLPERRIKDFLKGLEKLMVIEELSPYLEGFAKQFAFEEGSDLEIIGKGIGLLSEFSEYSIPLVINALSEITGIGSPIDHLAHKEKIEKLADILPMRPPGFCAGCPHRGTFTALRRAAGNIPIYFSNDIGCYTMLVLPPLEFSDSQLCMGASLGIGAGVSISAEEKVVVAIGDSTLFHAGLPGIVNAVHNKRDMTIIVLHNSVTAMTGQQSHPGEIGTIGGKEGISIDIERMLRALGVQKIVNIDSFQIRRNRALIKEVLEFKGVSAVISHGECALYHFRNLRKEGAKPVPFFVDKEKCRAPYNCIRDFLCPAISIDPADGKSQIDPSICVGCGECAQMCGFGAIRSTAVLRGGEDRVYYTKEDYDQYMEVISGKEVVR